MKYIYQYLTHMLRQCWHRKKEMDTKFPNRDAQRTGSPKENNYCAVIIIKHTQN
jgi:hypothetical protein